MSLENGGTMCLVSGQENAMHKRRTGVRDAQVSEPPNSRCNLAEGKTQADEATKVGAVDDNMTLHPLTPPYRSDGVADLKRVLEEVSTIANNQGRKEKEWITEEPAAIRLDIANLRKGVTVRHMDSLSGFLPIWRKIVSSSIV